MKNIEIIKNLKVINDELVNNENTKYTTVNGVKEFSCKDGYVDNIAIEGQTKILDANNNPCEPGATGAKLVSVGQGDKIEVLTKNSDETKTDKKQILTTLRSLPNNVKDEIVKQCDKYYKVERCGEIDIDDGSNLLGGQLAGGAFECYMDIDNTFKIPISADVYPNMYCNMFAQKMHNQWNDGTEGIHINSQSKRLYFNVSTSKLTTQDVAGFKLWLKNNPISIAHELATPNIIELPNFNPQTYAGKTTLLLNTGVVQGDANFEVTNGLRNEIDVVKDKVSNLGDDIISLVNYNDRWLDGVVRNDLELINAKSGFYQIVGESGHKFPYGYGTVVVSRYSQNGATYIFQTIEIGNSLNRVWFAKLNKNGLSTWTSLANSSTFDLLEQQVQTLEEEKEQQANKITTLTSINMQQDESILDNDMRLIDLELTLESVNTLPTQVNRVVNQRSREYELVKRMILDNNYSSIEYMETCIEKYYNRNRITIDEKNELLTLLRSNNFTK